MSGLTVAVEHRSQQQTQSPVLDAALLTLQHVSLTLQLQDRGCVIVLFLRPKIIGKDSDLPL